MKNLEQELKLSLTEREYNMLLAQSDVQPVLQTNYYFVFDGQAADEMLRIRSKNDVFTICFKRRLTHGGDVTVCDEYECELTRDVAVRFINNGIPYRTLNELFPVQASASAKYAGKTDTYRAAFMLDRWGVELDKTCYLGVTDFELECENDHVEELSDLKSYLHYNFGVVIRNSKPKNQRFFERLAEM